MFRLAHGVLGTVILASVLSAGARAGEGGKAPEKKVRAAFAAGPAVSRDGKKVVITFTATRPTVVTVEVLDSKGRVVRHLASGLLGFKAPAAPLAAAALAQKLVWDRLDDRGKPAPAGCRVRVALGLTPVFDRVISWGEPGILNRGAASLACDSRGRLYIMDSLPIADILVFGRDGKYERTMVPPPEALAPSRKVVSTGVGVFSEARPAGLTDWPGVVAVSNSREFHSELRPAGLTGHLRPQVVTVVGERLFFVGGFHWIQPPGEAPGTTNCRRHVHALGLDGVPREDYFGPSLPYKPVRTGYQTQPVYLAVTPDGKTVYVSGLRVEGGGDPFHVVYRAAWSDKELAPWFGEFKKPGGDETHLNEPRGLALDAKGRVYVCDWGNNRILVLTPEKKLVARIEVPGPDMVCVHPTTGAIYVYSIREPRWFAREKSLIKFAGVEDGAGKLAELPMPWKGKGPGSGGIASIMALDASDPKEPRLWISSVQHHREGGYLWLVADRGGKLERLPTPVPLSPGPGQCAIAVDVAREEVYAAITGVGVYRIDGRTGKIERLEKVSADIRKPKGATRPSWRLKAMALDFGPDDLLYVRWSGQYSGWENWIRRYDREGNRVPFTAAGDELEVIQASKGYHPGGFKVMEDGSIYVMNHFTPEGWSKKDLSLKFENVLRRLEIGKKHNVLAVYGPDGTITKPDFIPFLTESVWGPRFGPDGSIYITEGVRPRGMPRPSHGTSVGSLLKFKPGASPRLRFGDKASPKAPYEMRRFDKNIQPAEIHGLDWAYYGASPVAFGHCVCEGSAFDVDGHGRACVPNAADKHVTVLDAAGNVLARFGKYGNRDTQGLRTPSAVGLSDEAIYIADRKNLRVVRARWTYDAEQKLRVP